MEGDDNGQSDLGQLGQMGPSAAPAPSLRHIALSPSAVPALDACVCKILHK